MQYFEYLSHLFKYGNDVVIKGKRLKELLNVRINVFNDNLFFTEVARSEKRVTDYLYGELAWYFSGNRYVKGISKYSKFWEQIQNKDETANSNYGHRILYDKRYEYTMLDWCAMSLIKDRFSRQAIALYNSKQFFYEGNKDFICTQTQQFFIRHNELSSTVYMRSSDAILGLTYDIPWFSLVQQQLRLMLLAKYPELEVGPITIFIGSGHIYETHFSLVEDMLKDEAVYKSVELKKLVPLGNDNEWYENNLNDYIKITGGKQCPTF